jgi:hypothetical protein
MTVYSNIMKNYQALLLLVCLYSCQQNGQTKAAIVTSDTLVVKETAAATKQHGDTIHLDLQAEKGLAIAEASIDSLHPRTYVQFNMEEVPVLLKARIVPTTGTGNIRFNQILFPDNTSDGPFGTDLEIHLKQKGRYILVIGRSLMADNPFSGGFKVLLETVED